MKKIFSLLIITVIIASCSKDDVIINSEYIPKTFVSAELKSTYSKTNTLLLLALAKTQLGDALNLPSDEFIDGFEVYYVRYQSAYYDDSKQILSGLICVPNNINRESKIISFQNGTMAKHSSAPSNNLVHEEFLILQSLAGLGNVIVIPDYIGFGESENLPHPYHHKKSFQQSVRDLIIAVQDMEKSEDYNFSLSGDLFLTGYSLGGWASLVSHKSIEDEPIEGLNLIGSACGAGAYNLMQMRDYLIQQTNYSQSYYVPYMLSSFKSVEELEYPYSTYLNEPYASRIPDLINGENSSSQINSQLTSNLQELFTESFLDDFNSDKPEWKQIRELLINNSQAAWINKKPISLFHGNADKHVPYEVSEQLFSDFIAIGANEQLISFTTLEGKDHTTGVLPMYLQVINDLIKN